VNSGLLLVDGLYSVRDICKVQLDSVELIVLSGCGTSQTGVNLTDEAIHIASAFQMSGYHHVIGTLWPIIDQVAEEFAALFYMGLCSGNADPAFALQAATRRLRDMHLDMPVLWAPLTHLGPSRAVNGESMIVRLR
jgi:CHAT domain-containing protein